MKQLKYLFYFILITAIYSFVVFNNKANLAFKIIAYILISICAILLLIMLIKVLINKKENTYLISLLKENKNEELLNVIDNYINKNNKEKLSFYYYLKIAALLSINKEKEAFELFDLVNKEMYPIIYYYQALIEFNNDNYENIDNLINLFIDSLEYRMHSNYYQDYIALLNALKEYKNRNKKEALSILESTSINSFTMPCSTKAINKIKETN